MALAPVVSFVNATTQTVYSSGGNQWNVKATDGIADSVKVGSSSETLNLRIWNNKGGLVDLCSDMQECLLFITGDGNPPIVTQGWLKGKCAAISANEVTMNAVTKLPVGAVGQPFSAAGGTISGALNDGGSEDTSNFALVNLRFDLLDGLGITHGQKPFSIVLNYFYT